MIFNTQITLFEKRQLTEMVWEYKYKVPENFTFKPGQFVSIVVKPPLRRSYSILEIKDGLMTLIVDLSPGGPGSQYFENAKIDEPVSILGPLGVFSCDYSKTKKVFISTGTGLVPFIPMVKEIYEQDSNAEVEFYFGTRSVEHSKAYNPYLEDLVRFNNFKLFRCITQPEGEIDNLHVGRVTKILPEKSQYVSDTQFYICGVNQMIFDMQDVLKGLAISDKNIFFEKYG